MKSAIEQVQRTLEKNGGVLPYQNRDVAEQIVDDLKRNGFRIVGQYIDRTGD